MGQARLLSHRSTLDEIEHAVLRRQFSEPRIHVALVCAAIGCPPLRNEPYTGDGLTAQLDDQARRFLTDPEKFRIDRLNGRIYLSSIFKWFGEDFQIYGTQEQFAGYSSSESAVLDFVSRYLDEADFQYLRIGKYDIKYLDYDWSLNEQGGG